MTAPADPGSYFFVNNDGYLTLAHYSNPEDESSARLVCFVTAGDSLATILTKVEEFEQGPGQNT